MTETEDGLDLQSVRRKKNSYGQNAEVGQAIALIGVQILGRRNQATRSDDGAKFPKDKCVHGGLSRKG
jgi:hypothetical protein